MKKKYIYILLVTVLMMTGCGQKAEGNDVVSDNQVVVQATDAPEETVKPDEAVKATEEPLTTEVPTEQAEQPVELTTAPAERTEAPAQTEKPVEKTEAPKATEKPVEDTKAPVMTVEPTKAPVATAAPTKAPVVTVAPTKAPVVTVAPTKAPVVTVEPTKAPVATTAPTQKPTEAPTICAHTFDSGKVTTDATCTATGVKTFTCTSCGETKTEEVAKVAHCYKNETVAATCGTDGYSVDKCTACGDRKNEVVYPKTHAHDYVWGIIYKEPTCAATGSAEGTCKVCGYGNVATVPKTDDHNYVVTYQGCGFFDTQYNCSVCGDTKIVNENLSCVDSNGDHFCDIGGCYLE